MADDMLFEVPTSLGFKVRVTRAYWELIVTIKHPAMRGREADVQESLRTPDEIRRSLSDPAVYLFYRLERPERWICAVAKRLNDEGFLITTYPTDAIKGGELVWSK
jgi:hypothetical protein